MRRATDRSSASVALAAIWGRVGTRRPSACDGLRAVKTKPGVAIGAEHEGHRTWRTRHSAPARAGVEGVAQPVPDQVEGQDRGEEEGAGKNRDPPRLLQAGLAAAD